MDEATHHLCKGDADTETLMMLWQSALAQAVKGDAERALRKGFKNTARTVGSAPKITERMFGIWAVAFCPYYEKEPQRFETLRADAQATFEHLANKPTRIAQIFASPSRRHDVSGGAALGGSSFRDAAPC